MPIRTARTVPVAAGALATAALDLAGCAPAPDHDAPSGTTVTQDGVAYSVQISRALNPLAPDDRAVIAGLPYRPLPMPAGNDYAYHGGPMAPEQEIPGSTSPSDQTSADGVALVPTGVFLTDRPFTFAFGTGSRAASVQLDL